jgi:hypothetical protein
MLLVSSRLGGTAAGIASIGSTLLFIRPIEQRTHADPACTTPAGIAFLRYIHIQRVWYALHDPVPLTTATIHPAPDPRRVT